jgi:SAM-dependent methyltransferase
MVEGYNKAARELGKSEQQMSAIQGDILNPSHSQLEGKEYFDFDLIAMSLALHHVDEQQLLTDSLVKRLKPGGTILFIDWAPDDNDPVKGEGKVQQTFGHSAAFSENRMNELFRNAGCKETGYKLATDKSEVSSDPTGWKRMFFAKGVK